MRIYHFARMKPPASLDDDEAMDVLVAAATHFLRAGGIWTPHEWAELDEAEKIASVIAGDNMLLQRTALIGKANQGQGGILEVLSPLDDGEAQRLSILQEHTRRAIQRLNGEQS